MVGCGGEDEGGFVDGCYDRNGIVQATMCGHSQIYGEQVTLITGVVYTERDSPCDQHHISHVTVLAQSKRWYT